MADIRRHLAPELPQAAQQPHPATLRTNPEDGRDKAVGIE